jgi:hypothetical protein
MHRDLPKLKTKEEVNEIIRNTLDKVLVLRFGKEEEDLVTLLQDDIVRKMCKL